MKVTGQRVKNFLNFSLRKHTLFNELIDSQFLVLRKFEKGVLEMGKTRTKAADQISEAISLLKRVSQAWPEGFSHPLIREVLKKAELEFLHEFYEVSTGRSCKKSVEAGKKTSPKKE